MYNWRPTSAFFVRGVFGKHLDICHTADFSLSFSLSLEPNMEVGGHIDIWPEKRCRGSKE